MRIFTYIAITLSLVIVFGGCASQGRLNKDDFQDIQYTSVKRTLSYNYNPPFIIAGDSQPGKRIVEKFLRKENIATWKQLIVPFYQVYWISNGFLGGYKHITHTSDYGANDRFIMNKHLVNHINSNHTEFYLMLGDIVGSDGRYPSHWETFFDSFGGNEGIITQTTIYPIIGNHEYANNDSLGYYNYNLVFNSDRFYTIESPDMALIVLDSNFLIDQAGLIDDEIQEHLFRKWFVGSPETPSWLENELDKYPDKIIIVAMHHSPMMLGWHFKDWYNPENGLDLAHKRKELVEVFKKNNVKLVLSGHEHYYQHNILKYNNEEMHFVITSSAGVPIRSKPDEDILKEKLNILKNEGYDLSSKKQEDVYHFSRVEFSNEELIFITYQIESGKPDRIIDTLRLALLNKLPEVENE